MIPNIPDGSIRLMIKKGGEETVGMSISKGFALEGRRVVREENTTERNLLKTSYKLSENCDDRTNFMRGMASPMAMPAANLFMAGAVGGLKS